MEQTKQSEKNFDITKYPEGPKEVIKYMDQCPDDNTVRLKQLESFLAGLMI